MTFSMVTLTGSTTSIMPIIPMAKCDECRAVVETQDQQAHEYWHRQLMRMQGPPGPVGMTGDPGKPLKVEHVTTTSITIPADDLKRLMYWVDGLYVLLGEQPPYNVDWDESR